MGLLVGVQPVRVELSPDLAPASIVYYLDGTVAGEATAPPWEVRIDFGHDLRPHELVAAAMNAAGDRIASVSRILNLPAPESRLDLLIERKGSRPPSSIRLVATSLTREKPVRESLALDGRPLELDADARAVLPPLDLALTHVLSATAEFTQESVARADLAIGGGIQDDSGSRLTAVAIRVGPGADPTAESLRSRLRRGTQILRVVAVEKGDASVFLVRNPDTKTSSACARLPPPIFCASPRTASAIAWASPSSSSVRVNRGRPSRKRLSLTSRKKSASSHSRVATPGHRFRCGSAGRGTPTTTTVRGRSWRYPTATPISVASGRR